MKLTELRREMQKEEKMGKWQTRHLRGREKKKADVRVEGRKWVSFVRYMNF